MKRTGKLFALLAAIAMALVLVPRLAWGAAEDYSITINNALVGETYSAYKIFDDTQATGTVEGSYVKVSKQEMSKEGNENIKYYKLVNTAYEEITNRDEVIADSTVEFVYEKVYNNIAYSIHNTNPWFTTVNNYASQVSNGLTLTPLTSDANTYLVTITEGTFSAASFAQALKNNLDSLTGTDLESRVATAAMTMRAGESSSGNGTATDSVTLNVGTTGNAGDAYRGAGYYFVDTSLGSLCALNTTTNTTTITEKNDAPTISKKVFNTSLNNSGNAIGWAETDDAQIGDIVYFKTTVTDGLGTDTSITIYDRMSEGLTLDTSSIIVYKKVDSPLQSSLATYYELTGNVPAITTDTSVDSSKAYYTVVGAGSSTYSVETSSIAETTDNTGASFAPTFQINLSDSYVSQLTEDNEICIYYSATVDKDAVMSPTANPNDTFLKYSNQKTPISAAKVYTHEFDIVKYTQNGSNNVLLSDAEFMLYRFDQFGDDGKPNPSAVPISFVQGTSGDSNVYRIADSEQTSNTSVTRTSTLTSGAEKAINVEGLDEGTYYLVETKAPNGFNALTKPIKIEVSRAASNTAEATATANVKYVTGTDAANSVISYTGNPATGTGVATIGSGTPKTWTSGGVPVLNQAGTELPSTGGLGTKAFYAIGGSLFAASVIFLLTKKRLMQAA